MYDLMAVTSLLTEKPYKKPYNITAGNVISSLHYDTLYLAN